MTIPERPNLDPLPLPDQPGLLGGWGRKLEITVLRFLLEAYNTVMGPFWAARDSAAKFLFQTIEDELKPVLEPLLDRIDANPAVPEEIRAMTRHIRFSEPITFAAIGATVIVSAIVGVAMGLMEPIRRLAAQEVDSYAHSARMTPQEAFAALRKGVITQAEYHNHLSDGGWSEELEEVWETILAPLVGIGDLGRLYLREEIGDSELNTELGRRGYLQAEIEKIKSLLYVIPPLTDIIRMAVREAFTPEIVERFELHAELPAEMVAWARKQGLSTEWARAYWASHWELPPLTMGFEMMHRGEIDQEEMAMLIKAHDVSPFWRDKLLAISYNPYTRVDVRRMYKTGVIGQTEVNRTYLDLGYDEEKAANLTTFTVALANAAERDLTKADIMYGYEHGILSPSENDVLMLGLGYDQTEVDYYKTKVDFKRWQTMVKETVKFVSQEYIANQISESDVYSQLGAINLPATQMNHYLREWGLKKEAKTKRLTSESLVKFKTSEVITDDQFSEEMSGLGYSQKYIDWFLTLMQEE